MGAGDRRIQRPGCRFCQEPGQPRQQRDPGGEALHYELRKTGVTVTVVSPGVTKTEFLEVAGQQPSLYQRTMMMDSPDVTRIAVDAMLKGKASIVPGYKNAVLALSTRLTPRQLAAMSADRFMTIGSGD